MNHRVLLVLLLALSSSRVHAQKMSQADIDRLPSVPADEAKHNLISSGQPAYPPEAQTARIVGVVRIEIAVDETGKVQDLYLISGHPMLAPPAMRSVKLWKYKPFQIEGKPAVVRTEVDIGFPPGIEEMYAAREREFQQKYWADVRTAQQAAVAKDWPTAETRLKAARHTAEEAGAQKWAELSTAVAMMAAVRSEQKDYPAAEHLFKEALKIREKNQQQEAPEVAELRQNLAFVFLCESLPKSAEPLYLQSVRTYESRILDTNAQDVRASYGRHLAVGYSALARIAQTDGRTLEAKARCEKAVGYAGDWASDAEKENIRSGCASLLGDH
jgi:TonB family protein